VTDHDEDMDLRLGRLRELTDSIGPAPEFSGKVMASLATEQTAWLYRIPNLWHRTLPVAVLLAMLSALWAYENARAADVRIAGAADPDELMEMDWQ
jgi:hypothetical protein